MQKKLNNRKKAPKNLFKREKKKLRKEEPKA
jgi:hypothetical protein